jgi:hypothetical protein
MAEASQEKKSDDPVATTALPTADITAVSPPVPVLLGDAEHKKEGEEDRSSSEEEKKDGERDEESTSGDVGKQDRMAAGGDEKLRRRVLATKDGMVDDVPRSEVLAPSTAASSLPPPPPAPAAIVQEDAEEPVQPKVLQPGELRLTLGSSHVYISSQRLCQVFLVLLAVAFLAVLAGIYLLPTTSPDASSKKRGTVLSPMDRYKQRVGAGKNQDIEEEDEEEEPIEDEDLEDAIDEDDEEEEEEEEQESVQPVVTSTATPKRKWDKLAFYLQSREAENIASLKVSANDLKLLETAEDTRAFVFGYLRAHLACEEAANRRDWVVSPQTLEKMPFENPLYLSTNTRFGPYFCINFPVDCYLVTAQELAAQTGGATAPRQPYYAAHLRYGSVDDEDDTDEEEEEEEDEEADVSSNPLTDQAATWRDVWIKQMANFDGGVDRVVSSSDAFAKSSVHTAEMLGYHRDSFLSRNFVALGRPQHPEASFDIVNYTALVEMARQLTLALVDTIESAGEVGALTPPSSGSTRSGKSPVAPPVATNVETAGTSACVCGPHLGIARHIVIYINANTHPAKTVIYVEPIIVWSNAAEVTSSPPPPTVAAKSKAKRKAARSQEESVFAWVTSPSSSQAMPSPQPHHHHHHASTTPAAAKDAKPRELRRAAALQQRLALYQRYLRTDEQLRAYLPVLDQLGYNKELLATEVRVDHFELFTADVTVQVPSPRGQRGKATAHAPRTTTATIHVLDNNHRSIVASKGQEAYCLQYCQAMAYSLADAMGNQTLVKSSADLVLPPLAEPPAAKKKVAAGLVAEKNKNKKSSRPLPARKSRH